MIAELRVIASAWLGWLADIIHPADPVPVAPWPEDQPLGEWPPYVPAAGVETPDSAGGGHLTLPERMHAAADTLREINALYDYDTERGNWSPEELLKEAKYVAFDYPGR